MTGRGASPKVAWYAVALLLISVPGYPDRLVLGFLLDPLARSAPWR